MIKLSKGNAKLGGIYNTSVRPILDCKKNVPCRHKCYARKAWRQYPNVRAAWRHNSRAWKEDPIGSAKSVIRQLEGKSNITYFRIHVGGDFMDKQHLDMWKIIAHRLPSIKFLAFTKRYDLNYGFIPQNLKITFSMWPGEAEPVTEYAFNKAWVQNGQESRIPLGAHKCPGSCTSCKHCWESDRDVYFKIH